MVEAIFVGLVVWALTSRLEKADTPALKEWTERPPDTSATALNIVDFRGGSGAKYRATSFAMGDGGTYTVARRRSNKDWIGFITAPNGLRAFWRADAGSQGGLDVMRKDFGV